MLNPNAQKWVDALRSGDYAQGRDTLTEVSVNGIMRHCCLGVACQVAIADGVPITTFTRPGCVEYLDSEDPEGNGYSTTTLPPAVESWLGIGYDYGWLATLNDSGSDFDSIATEIEIEAHRLFGG